MLVNCTTTGFDKPFLLKKWVVVLKINSEIKVNISTQYYIYTLAVS